MLTNSAIEIKKDLDGLFFQICVSLKHVGSILKRIDCDEGLKKPGLQKGEARLFYFKSLNRLRVTKTNI
jgi:hypothetical protein